MAVAFVQDDVGVGFGVTEYTVAFGSNVTAGSIIAFGVYWQSSSFTLSGVAQSAGTATIGSVTLLHNPTTDPVGTRAAMGYCVVTGSGSLSLTATVSSAVSGGIVAHEISGGDTASPLGKSAMQFQSDPGTGTDALTSGAQTTETNGEYIFGFFVDSWQAATTFTQGTGFTLRDVQGNRMFSESMIQTSAGSIAATGTWTLAAPFDAISGMMTFKAAAAGGATFPGYIGPQGWF